MDYKHIDVIGAKYLFTDPGNVRVNEETRSIPVAQGGGIYFAFQDTGACMTLLSVRVYYIACPQVVMGLAGFPAASAGPELASVVRVSGVCVEDSYGELIPAAFCKADGSWLTVSDGCVCREGFRPDHAAQTCTGEFMWINQCTFLNFSTTLLQVPCLF